MNPLNNTPTTLISPAVGTSGSGATFDIRYGKRLSQPPGLGPAFSCDIQIAGGNYWTISGNHFPKRNPGSSNAAWEAILMQAYGGINPNYNTIVANMFSGYYKGAVKHYVSATSVDDVYAGGNLIANNIGQ